MLEAQVPVQAGRVVLLDDEPGACAERQRGAAARLGVCAEVALGAVSLELVGRHPRQAKPPEARPARCVSSRMISSRTPSGSSASCLIRAVVAQQGRLDILVNNPQDFLTSHRSWISPMKVIAVFSR